MSLRAAYVSRLVIPVGLALALGCGSSPTAPITPKASLRLDLSLSSTAGAPGSPITARASVRNTGRVPVWYFGFCYDATPVINIWESDHHNVEEICGHCPNALCLACAGEPTTLKPGEVVQVQRTFDGQLYTCDGPYEVAAGDYTVELLFRGHGSDYELFTVTRSAVIHWATNLNRRKESR